jgi:leucyl-tRNA synthetase
MTKYNHSKIEKKWQKKWAEQKLYATPKNPGKKKKYILDMFPYPSGAGLHVGHPEGYTATDIYSRYLRMNGYDVLHPMGWDAFGLPAENYAIKEKIHPAKSTAANIKRFRQQIQSLGLSYDWDREVNTSDPEYYKWTQWLFLKFYEKGLAYRKEAYVNWCPKDQTVLANEQVIAGRCERCGTQVVQKLLSQWFYKITDYADELLDGLEKIDWPEPIKTMQRNWIGRSEGAEIEFPLAIKSNYIVLPGWTSSEQDNFYPWLTKSLQSTGARAQTIVYKRTEKYPENEIIADLLQKSRLDEGSVLIGHSLGGVMALKMLEKLKQPISKLVLVGSFLTPKFLDKARSFEKELNWNFDFEAIKKNAKQIVILQDESDQIVPESASLALKEKLGGSLVKFRASKPHVKGKEELEVLNAVKNSIKVFTTRPDTIFGATYMVLAPENPQVKNLQFSISNFQEVEKYIEQAKSKTELQRTALEKDKIGVELKGVWAINPATKEKIPVWIADYVLMNYGTGAIMAVPAHDFRDWEFATQQGINIRKVNDGISIELIGSTEQQAKMIKLQEIITKEKVSIEDYPRYSATRYFNRWFHAFEFNTEEAKKKVFKEIKAGGFKYIEHTPFVHDDWEAKVINSDFLNGLTVREAKNKVIEWLEKNEIGSRAVQFKLRDWLISRQRYWGAPIPIIYCHDCGMQAVPEKDLPVTLPTDVDFQPTGESPLARSKSFNKVKCPNCGKAARRETDTMDTFVDSSWYWLRYTDPNNAKEFASAKEIAKWCPVDVYVGGAEHAVLHLMYARFFCKVLRDLGYLNFDEPFLKLRNQGLVLGPDGQKMSKSRGNVINPDDIVEEFGADSMRMYEMFMGPLEDAKPWNIDGIKGVFRFLSRVSNFYTQENSHPDSPKIHKLIKKITMDIQAFKFNTAVAAFMEYYQYHDISKNDWKIFLKLLFPFAPHLTEELWAELGHKKSIQLEQWPKYDPELIKEEKVSVAVQVNGKHRATIELPVNAGEDAAKLQALKEENVAKYLDGKTVRKVIYVPGKIINFVVGT